MKKPFIALLTALLVVSASAVLNGASLRYTLTDLSAGPNPGYCKGMNFLGDIVGLLTTPDGHTRPYILADGVVTELPTRPVSYSDAQSINIFRQVVGFDQPVPSFGRAFLYSNGVMKYINTLGGSSNAAVAVNNLGQVTGTSETANGEAHAFIYSAGQLKDLGTLGGALSIALWINDLGQVTGYSDTADGSSYAFLYSGGKMKNLGAFGGPGQSWAYRINNRGQVTGAATIPGEEGFYHAFLYSKGTLQDLGTLGGSYSSGQDLNNLEQVIGFSYLADGSVHGFIFANQILHDLNDLVIARGSWVITGGVAINDRGEILCDAMAPDGYSRQVLLKPSR